MKQIKKENKILENTLEIGGDIAEGLLEEGAEEVADGTSNILSDLFDGVDDLPGFAIFGIIAGIIAAIGAIILVVKKNRK